MLNWFTITDESPAIATGVEDGDYRLMVVGSDTSYLWYVQYSKSTVVNGIESSVDLAKVKAEEAMIKHRDSL